MKEQPKDPFELALIKYMTQSCTDPIVVHARVQDMELHNIAIDMFFESLEDFPEIDKIAYQHCRGTILDVGAGVGRFALPLQNQGMKVVAVEKLPEAAKIMQLRGVRDVRCSTLDDFLEQAGNDEKFDTILMMMNGMGIVGTLEKLEEFLQRIKRFLHPKGQILADSMNIKASTYNDFSQHVAVQQKRGDYIGEIQMTFTFEGAEGMPFPWVHVDENTLVMLAHKHGWEPEILFRGEDGRYLFRLMLLSAHSQIK